MCLPPGERVKALRPSFSPILVYDVKVQRYSVLVTYSVYVCSYSIIVYVRYNVCMRALTLSCVVRLKTRLLVSDWLTWPAVPAAAAAPASCCDDTKSSPPWKRHGTHWVGQAWASSSIIIINPLAE